MPSRAKDWMRQALRDAEHARASLERGRFEWAAFAAQQAAEKAVKAVFQSLGADARGHSVTELLSALPPQAAPSMALVEAAKGLGQALHRSEMPQRLSRPAGPRGILVILGPPPASGGRFAGVALRYE